MKALFSKWYDKKIDATGLALFRIFYFLVFFCEIAQMFYFKELIFDKIPFVDPYEINFTWAFYAWFVCIWCLILGLKTRTMAIVNYAFTLVFLSTISTYEYHVFYTYTTVNFFCLVLPVSKRLSLDRLLLKLKYSNTKFEYEPPATTTILSYTIPILVAVAFVYTDSMLYKITSDFWMSGLGVWYPSAFPQVSITSSSGLGGGLVNNYYLAKAFGYLTVTFETVFIFTFWFRRFRVPLLIIGMGLHLGIMFTFPIPWFALAVAATYILLIPVAWYRKVGNWITKRSKPSLVVYYDEECPLCIRTKIVVRHFDVFHTIEFKGVQSNREDAAITTIALDDLLDNIYSVTANGKVQYGLDTYVQILFKMKYTFLLALLLKLPGVYHLAKKVYQYVAANRNVERCTEDSCGYIAPPVVVNPDDIKLLQSLTIRDVRVYGIIAGIGMLVFLQLGISYTSGAAGIAMEKIGFSETTVGKWFKNTSAEFNLTARPLLGLTHHPVFMDSHFANYVQIVSVIYQSGSGEEVRLPIIDERGSPDYYIYGANWVKWTFRVNSPNGLNEKKLRKGIKDFTAFWAHKNNIGTENATFKIEVKLIDMPTGFEVDFTDKQRKKPWNTLGQAKWENNKFDIVFNNDYQYLFR